MLGMLIEVEGDGGSLVLDGDGTRDVGVHQVVQQLGAKGGEELQRSSEHGLVDGEALRERVGGGGVGRRHGGYGFFLRR